jgi:hypothetical protein
MVEVNFLFLIILAKGEKIEFYGEASICLFCVARLSKEEDNHEKW